MAAADDLKPLDAAIDEIRLLHGAAVRAAARIGAEAGRIGEPGAMNAPLLADVAEALVGRTEAIRGDCERLEALLDRARGALAAATVTPPPAGEPPYAAPPRPSEPEYPVDPPFVAPEPGLAERSSWRFWRRDRDPEPPGQTPPRLPRPDWAAMGVGPAVNPGPAPAARQPVPEGVRLIATQMAVAGSSRTEIERRLQREFGVADAGAALDEVFGYGGLSPIE